MIINREKFQAILLNKRKSDLPNLYLSVDYKAIKSTWQVMYVSWKLAKHFVKT